MCLHYYKLLIIFLLCLRQVEWALTIRKLVYQKDMSEYCRRRVMPSVFLGTHVAEAHSQILHFSKTELPYSCFISVRGELGSNIILVAQLISDTNLVGSCGFFPNQLLVYEMGETFGGYWGPLPEVLLRPKPTKSVLYVRKTTTTTKKNTGHLLTDNGKEKTIKTTSEVTIPVEMPPDYMEVEVPLLNLTGHFEDDENGVLQKPFNIEDNFDILFDVTPGANERYETSELPMLQFSVGLRGSGGYGIGTDTMFDFEYGGGSTVINPKVPYLTIRTTVKKKTLFRRKFKQMITKKKKLYTVNRKSKLDRKLRLDNRKPSHTSERTWEQIVGLLKELNETNLEHTTSRNDIENITRILQSLSKLNHNYSAYLHPNWKSIDTIENYPKRTFNKYNFSLFTRKLFPHLTLTTRNYHQLMKSTVFFNFTNDFSTTTVDMNTKNKIENKTQLTTEQRKNTVVDFNFTDLLSNNNKDDNLKGIITTEQSPKVYNTTIFTISSQVEIEDTTHKFLVTPTESPSPTQLSASMVDHESWENVVQAAPVMAVLLNRTVTPLETNIAADDAGFIENTTSSGMRLKRMIQAIPIANARPHALTTREDVLTTETRLFYASDLQDFAQLVELQDDELHDRVALRYLRQYVGPILFNICDFTEAKARHVFLFNSSRIVIAISNFTLERMSVVLTPARTLYGGAAKCSDFRLECQVFGTRVCIDKINACDGVPNCGAFDIYDEDRLTCGAAVGLQHNVYLAAITFIAVLLTMLYTVHYWLKRCVPKVSEAFFIYTDRAENTLYLESIMRSPHDIGGSNVPYHGNLSMGEDLAYDFSTKKIRRSLCYSLWHCCFAFLTCRGKRKEVTDLKIEIGRSFKGPKMYSFTELELKNIGTGAAMTNNIDVSVQTGESLEIDHDRQKMESSRKHISLDMPTTSSELHNAELHLLKLMKESKAQCKDPCVCAEKTDKTSLLEKELLSYDLHASDHLKSTLSPEQKKTMKESPRPESSKHAVKHLRFDVKEAGGSTEKEEEEPPLQWFSSSSAKSHKKDDVGKAEGEETNAGISRELKRFWQTKSKKTKKKTHLAIN